MYDLIIVGGGPSGLAAALSARRRGLDYLVIERGVIADTIYNYPIARHLFSTSNEVELEPSALPEDAKPTREEVLAHYTSLVIREKINIHTGEEVETITPGNEEFVVSTSKGLHRARAVLVAIGGFGLQRRLGVSGETSQRVSYRFTEAHPFALRPVLVVGGGNSAAEAALFLAEAGAAVTLSLRRPSLDWIDPGGSNSNNSSGPKIKPWVREPLERAASRGSVRILTSSRVAEVLHSSALIEIEGGRNLIEVACDHVFALIGADPDTRLLERAGAEIASDGRPVYSTDTYETTVAGLYVAGHLTRELHMKNAVEVGRRVVDEIATVISRQSVGV